MNRRYRKWMLQFHTYSGLFIAPFLVVMAISSLEFNHEFFSKSPWKVKTYDRKIQLPVHLNDEQIPVAIKDSLGIYGFETYWTRFHNERGYHFELDRPGRHYLMVWDSSSQSLNVTEQWTSIGTVFIGMHTIISTNPGSFVYTLWNAYGQLSMVLILVMLITSVWMWKAYAIKSRAEWVLAIGALFLVGFFIWYLWHVG